MTQAVDRFQCWTVPKAQDFPPEIDLTGCVVITSDTDHKGWLGKLIYTAQKTHNTFMRLAGRPKVNCDLRHASIILGKDPNPDKPDAFLIAHSGYTGIKTASWNPKTDPAITDTIIWMPCESRVREALHRAADQTAYNSQFVDPEYRVEKAHFSFKDMGVAMFRNHQTTPSHHVMERTARATAQLLVGDQLLNASGDAPQSFFCSAYVMTLLQAVLMLDALSDEEQTALADGQTGSAKEVTRLANRILDALEDDSVDDPIFKNLSDHFWSDSICQLDGRYVYSCYAAAALDKVSLPVTRARPSRTHRYRTVRSRRSVHRSGKIRHHRRG
jgi:hypothetical protein